jgi:hypothetical protein
MKKITVINRQLVWVEYQGEVEITNEQFEELQSGEIDISELNLNVDYEEPYFMDCEESEFDYEEVN